MSLVFYMVELESESSSRHKINGIFQILLNSCPNCGSQVEKVSINNSLKEMCSCSTDFQKSLLCLI